MNIQKLFDLYQAYNVFDKEALGIPQFEIDMRAEVENAIKAKTGRKPKNLNKAADILGEAKVKEINDKYGQLMQPRIKKRKDNKQKVENTLKEYAKNYFPQASEEMYKLVVSHAGNYHTQGYSCNKYAKGALEERRLMLQMCGFYVEIREIVPDEPADRWGIRYNTYELWGNITQFDYFMLNNKGVGFTEMDYAVMCWRNGVNPKVLFPFIDDKIFDQSMKYYNDPNYVIHLINPELEILPIN